jgi:hypothetical protein
MNDVRPGVPRWVKVSGVVIAILVLLVALVVIGGGEHGPSRHARGQYGGQVSHTALPDDATSGLLRAAA